MKAYKYKNNIALCLTEIFIWCMQIHFWFEASEIGDIPLFAGLRTLCFFCVFACVIVKWIEDARIRITNLWVLAIAMGIMAVSTVVSGGLTVAKLLLFGLALKGTNYVQNLKAFFRANVFILVFIISAAIVGIIENQVGYDGQAKYYYLGFENPNTAALLIYTVFIILVYFKFRHTTIKTVLFYSSVTFVVYKITNSRSAAIVMIIVCLLLVFNRYIFKIKLLFDNKAFRILSYVLFPLFSALSYATAYLYTRNDLVDRLNIAFSYRFALWHWYTELLSINLLGAPSAYDQLGTLDNSYLVMLYHYGILVWILYWWIFHRIFQTIFEQKNVSMYIITVAYEVYFLTEGYPFFINANIALLFFLTYFWQKDVRRVKRGKS